MDQKRKNSILYQDRAMACDHCSGVIEKQAVVAAGEPYYFYECQGCGCQWDTKGYRMTVGTHEACDNHWAALEFKLQNRLPTISRKTWIVIAVVVALMLLPVTGSILMATTVRLFMLLRLFIVPLAILLITYVIFRHWKNGQE
jgi:hypothetical protein